MDEYDRRLQAVNADREALSQVGINVDVRQAEDGEYFWTIDAPMGGALLLAALLTVAMQTCREHGQRGELPEVLDDVVRQKMLAEADTMLDGMPRPIQNMLVAEMSGQIARGLSTAIALKGAMITSEKERSE